MKTKSLTTSELGSLGNKGLRKKLGKGYKAHMAKIVSDYWKSPAGRKRKAAAAKARAKGRK